MADPNEHSVYREPHMAHDAFTPDPAEARAARNLGPREQATGDHDVEQSVWDEPAFSAPLAGGVPLDAPRYATWLEQQRAAMTGLRSWSVTVWVALAAGPWAVLGALFSVDQSMEIGWGALAVVVVGPLVEEIMKVALPLWLVEKKPYLFISRAQLLFCAMAGALMFAVIENLLYLYVYIPDASPSLGVWRWTVCTALHVGCSAIASLGLMRVWSRVWQTHKRAELAAASPYIITAIVIHGTYNAFALLLQALGSPF